MKKTPEFLPEARNPLTFLDPLIDPECYIGKVVSCSVRSYDYSANEMEGRFIDKYSNQNDVFK